MSFCMLGSFTPVTDDKEDYLRKLVVNKTEFSAKRDVKRSEILWRSAPRCYFSLCNPAVVIRLVFRTQHLLVAKSQLSFKLLLFREALSFRLVSYIGVLTNFITVFIFS